MAFPTVAATATSTGDETTDHTVNLPSGVVDGSRVEIYFAHDGVETVGWPGGWTELAEEDVSTAGFAYAYRDCDGTEGATITVTTGTTESSAHHSHRIEGHDSATPPEIASTVESGGTANPDPPSLNPTGWDVEETLWTCGFGNDATTDVSATPTNYTAVGHTDSPGGGGSACGVDTAHRQLEAASEDPGAWTNTISRDWVAYTVAHRPAGAGGVVLVAQDATHGLSSDSPALTQHNVLVVADTGHALSSDSPALTQHHVLVVADTGHVLSSESPTLTQHNVLAPADAAHELSSDSPTLTPHAPGGATLTAQDATHVLTSDSPAITQHHILAVADAAHLFTSDSPALTQHHVLAAADAVHGLSSESPTLTHHAPGDVTASLTPRVVTVTFSTP